MKGLPWRTAAAAFGSAVAAAVIIITPAFSQDAASFRFNWEVNFTTLLSMLAVGIGWYLTVTKQGETIKSHAETITTLKTALATKVDSDALHKMQEDVERLGISIQKVEIEHSTLKDEVYKEYLSVRAFDRIKDELRDDAHQTKAEVMDAINGLSKRIDNLASQRPAK